MFIWGNISYEIILDGVVMQICNQFRFELNVDMKEYPKSNIKQNLTLYIKRGNANILFAFSFNRPFILIISLYPFACGEQIKTFMTVNTI